jgi:hypothetical protein
MKMVLRTPNRDGLPIFADPHYLSLMTFRASEVVSYFNCQFQQSPLAALPEAFYPSKRTQDKKKGEMW